MTWDNPDIVLTRQGVVVSSDSLQPATDYEIVARIWNGSMNCPVVSLPVYFSFLRFGIGTTSTSIGKTRKTHVDLGVKGGTGCPAFAFMSWTTPAVPGHYCIQVRLAPPDDLVPENNVGQENTMVVPAHSPAEATFALRNETRVTRRYAFRVDAYEIPSAPPCDARPILGRSLARGRIDIANQGIRRSTTIIQHRLERHRPSLKGSETRIHHAATSWYSLIMPPSTPRRRIRPAGTWIGATWRVSGAARSIPRCGRCEL